MGPVMILMGVLAPSSPSRSGGRLERWGRLPWKACIQTPEAWAQSGAQDHDPTVPIHIPGGHPGCCGDGGRGQGGERISHAGWELGEPRHGEGESWLLGFLTWPLWASIASFNQMAVEDKSEQVNCLQQRRRHSPQKISRVSLLLLPVTAPTFLSSQCRQGLSASSAPVRELSGHRALVPLVCGGAPVHSGHHSCWDVASAPSSGAAFRWGGAVPGLVR